MKWISVNDSLPEENTLVLVANGQWLGLRYFRVNSDGVAYWFDIAKEDSELNDYTHWMPLPEPPQ